MLFGGSFLVASQSLLLVARGRVSGQGSSSQFQAASISPFGERRQRGSNSQALTAGPKGGAIGLASRIV